jgi:hypothetical protein
MAENVQRSKGRPEGYKFDRGGQPAEMGPYIGIVVNNVDNTRSGRLQVYIEEFGSITKTGSPNLADKSLWRTVSYCPPFYGATPQTGTSTGTGKYPGNINSYGMWFTPPDLGVSVLCFFVGGDPKQGYYVGCIPVQGANQMIPAIGAVKNYQAQNASQETYFAGATQLPVTEINVKNAAIESNPKFFDQPKPVQSYVAGVLFQQGLALDTIRGSIASSSQRESPSNCYGISTPGRAIYQGGLTDATIQQQLQSDSVKLTDIGIIGRRGGHTLVMDDGDLSGKDNLVRIRTSKGHQITMSDDGDCLYICHANGQAWIELGQEGTMDVYTTNSVNLRTQGTINLHADEDINMFAGGKINMKSTKGTTMQSDADMTVSNKGQLTLFSQAGIGLKTPGTLAMTSQLGSWASSATLSFNGSKINLNGGPKTEVATPTGLTKYLLPKVEFNASLGWIAQPTGLESIVTRAPTHEPYPYHNQGVSVSVKFSGAPTPPPAAPAVPKDVKITKTGDAATKAAQEKAKAVNSGNAEEIAKLKTALANAQAGLAEDLELRATIASSGRSDAPAFLLEVDQIIADRRKVIAITQQKIATLGG